MLEVYEKYLQHSELGVSVTWCLDERKRGGSMCESSKRNVEEIWDLEWLKTVNGGIGCPVSAISLGICGEDIDQSKQSSIFDLKLRT